MKAIQAGKQTYKKWGFNFGILQRRGGGGGGGGGANLKNILI